MVWIAEIHIENKKRHLLQIFEIHSREKISIDEFLKRVNIQMKLLVEKSGKMNAYKVMGIRLDHYTESMWLEG